MDTATDAGISYNRVATMEQEAGVVEALYASRSVYEVATLPVSTARTQILAILGSKLDAPISGPQLSDTCGILIVRDLDTSSINPFKTIYRDGVKQEAEYVTWDDAIEGAFPTYAWPGGYPVLYLLPDGGELCPSCIQRFFVEGDWTDSDAVRLGLAQADIHYEGEPITCDHCDTDIASAYGPIEEEEAADMMPCRYCGGSSHFGVCSACEEQGR